MRIRKDGNPRAPLQTCRGQAVASQPLARPPSFATLACFTVPAALRRTPGTSVEEVVRNNLAAVWARGRSRPPAGHGARTQRQGAGDSHNAQGRIRAQTVQGGRGHLEQAGVALASSLYVKSRAKTTCSLGAPKAQQAPSRSGGGRGTGQDAGAGTAPFARAAPRPLSGTATVRRAPAPPKGRCWRLGGGMPSAPREFFF